MSTSSTGASAPNGPNHIRNRKLRLRKAFASAVTIDALLQAFEEMEQVKAFGDGVDFASYCWKLGDTLFLQRKFFKQFHKVSEIASRLINQLKMEPDDEEKVHVTVRNLAIGSLSNVLGYCFLYKDYYDSSLDCFERASSVSTLDNIAVYKIMVAAYVGLFEVKMAMLNGVSGMDSIRSLREAALVYMDKILEIKQKIEAPISIGLGNAYKDACDAYFEQGDYPTATRHCRTALSIYRSLSTSLSLLHEDKKLQLIDLKMAHLHSNVGFMKYQLRDYKAAQDSYETAFNLYKQHWSLYITVLDDHRQVWYHERDQSEDWEYETGGLVYELNLLHIERSNALTKSKQCTDAAALLDDRKVLEMYENRAAIGQNSAVGEDLRGLLAVCKANLKHEWNRPWDWKKGLEKATKYLDEFKNGYSIRVVHAYMDVAAIHVERREYKDAIKVYKKIITKSKAPSTIVISTLRALHPLLSKVGILKEEYPYLRDVVNELVRIYGSEHTDAGYGYAYLGDVCMDLHMNDEAVKYLKDATYIMDKTLGPNELDSLKIHQKLASSYARVGSYVLAISCQKKIVESMKITTQKDHLGEAHELLRKWQQEYEHTMDSTTDKVASSD